MGARRWRPVIFVAVVMFGELVAFLTIAAMVKRPRPDVPRLNSNLPTSAFPSGHTAATTCLWASTTPPTSLAAWCSPRSG
jgi:undecaprenyl-diphosphatase